MAVTLTNVARSGFWLPCPDGTPVAGGGNQPDPPPPPTGHSGLLIGSSAGAGSASSQAAFKASAGTAGPWTVPRVYNDSTFKSTWAADCGAWTDGRYACAWSCKPDLLLLAANTTAGAAERARLAAFVKSIPDSSVVFAEAWHELDVKKRQKKFPFSTGGLTVAQVNAGKKIFYDTVKQAGKPHLYTYLCLTDYSLKPGTTDGTPDMFWVGDTGASRIIDVVTWDVYMLSNPIPDVSAQLGPCFAWANNKGAACGFTEVGIHNEVTDYGNVATWMEHFADYCAAHGAGPHPSATMLCWFDTTNGSSLPVPSNSPTTIAASAGIAAAYQTPYGTFAL